MSVNISCDLEKKVEEVSMIMNLRKDEFVDRALRVFLDDIEKTINLRKEIREWDNLSDESLLNFERSI